MCSVAECDKKVYARGLCGRHYKQQLRHGQVQPDRAPKECAVPGCERRAVTRAWCSAHYLRWTRLGDTQPDVPLARRSAGPCQVPDCDRRAVGRGLCQAHRQRLRLTGDTAPGRPLREVAGDGFVNKGYRHVPVSDEERWLVSGAANAAEHRLVMARALQRPLTRDESVHHRNGDRQDNALDNLELWSRFQPNGQRVVDKLAWARELLRRYVSDSSHGLGPETHGRSRTATTARLPE